MTEPEPRPFTGDTEGMPDSKGNVWFLCDPYPHTWYRWEGRRLIRPDTETDRYLRARYEELTGI
jgi:hypothetical protein